MKKITLTDVMEADEFFKTSPRKNYLIKTPTGSGKTYFCIHTLLAKAWPKGEKILFLANRTAVIRQVREQVKKFAQTQQIDYRRICNSIVIKTYQNLEETILHGGNTSIFNKNNYRYVICDEAHYFVHDSNFNTNTWLSFTWLTQKSYATTFFMSATMECVEQRLIRTFMQCGPYAPDSSGYIFMKDMLYAVIDEIPADYSYIIPFCFDKIANIPHILKNLKGKTIIFVPSIAEGDTIYNLLKNSDIQNVKFLTSEYRKNKDMNDTMQQLIVDECVEAKILITTAVIDNGVNIKDKNFQNAFILTHTREDLIQALGRKRKCDDSPLNLFLCKRNSKYFYNIRKNYDNTLNVYDIYKNDFPQPLLQEYFSNDNYRDELNSLAFYYNPAYNQSPLYGGLCFNPLSVDNLLQNIRNCNEIINRFETDMMAFVHMQLEWLDSSLIEKLQDTSTEALMPKLVTLLESYKGKEMTAKEMGELIQTTFKNFIIALSKSHKYYSTSKISKPQFRAFLEECTPSYRLYDEKPAGKTQQFWWIGSAAKSNGEQ